MHCSFSSDIVVMMEDIDMMMNNCSNMSMGGMRMQFYFGLLPGGLLFTSWTINTIWEMVGSIVAILALGVTYEALKSFREFLMAWDEMRKRRKGRIHVQYSNENTPLVGKEAKNTSLWSETAKRVAAEYVNIFHIIQSILHVVQVGLGYMLMLVAMTYNGWLFMAVIFGAGLGYFVFGACRRTLSASKKFEEQNEHCT